MRWDNPIYKHGFVLPDIAAFPEYLDEPRGIDNDFVEKLTELFTANKVDDFMENVISRVGKASYLPTLYRQFKLMHKPTKSSRLSNIASRQLYDNGVYQTSINTSKLDVGQFVKEQLAKQDWDPPPGVYDRGCFLGDAFLLTLNDEFQKAGILDAVSVYSGIPKRVTKAYLHVSLPTDKHYKQFMHDATITPKWTNTHIDPKEDAMKAIVYLEDTTAENGAFGYVPGSNRYMFDPLQELFGRTISTGNYCMTPEQRKEVFALPPALRTTYNFGRCILDDSPMSYWLDSHFIHYTSDTGNTVVFDSGAGMHQGGIVKEGRRVSLQVLMK